MNDKQIEQQLTERITALLDRPPTFEEMRILEQHCLELQDMLILWSELRQINKLVLAELLRVLLLTLEDSIEIVGKQQATSFN